MTKQEIIRELGDIAGRFDISEEQADRIAANVTSVEEFIQVWEGQDWWVDA